MQQRKVQLQKKILMSPPNYNSNYIGKKKKRLSINWSNFSSRKLARFAQYNPKIWSFKNIYTIVDIYIYTLRGELFVPFLGSFGKSVTYLSFTFAIVVLLLVVIIVATHGWWTFALNLQRILHKELQLPQCWFALHNITWFSR